MSHARSVKETQKNAEVDLVHVLSNKGSDRSNPTSRPQQIRRRFKLQGALYQNTCTRNIQEVQMTAVSRFSRALLSGIVRATRQLARRNQIWLSTIGVEISIPSQFKKGEGRSQANLGRKASQNGDHRIGASGEVRRDRPDWRTACICLTCTHAIIAD